MKDIKRSRSSVMKSNNEQIDHYRPGVGGRQGECQALIEGGGYLDECIISDPSLKKSCAAANDLRLDDLRTIGLSHKLMAVADLVGFDLFIQIWKIIDDYSVGSYAPLSTPKRIHVPRFTSYLALQRNKYIASLSEEGLTVGEIRTRIKAELCEVLSERHIFRLVAASKISSHEQE